MKRVLLVFAVLTACVPASSVTPKLRSYLRVRNDHWLEQVVYADCGAHIRMGTVGGINEALLRVPRACEDRNVFFSTDPIGAHDVSRSDALEIRPGDVLLLHVPAFFNGYLFLSR